MTESTVGSRQLGSPEPVSSETIIHSFVLRFVQDPAAESEGRSSRWHGLIRHVPTNEEVRFTRIEEALDFLARYVTIPKGGGEDAVAP